MRLVEDEGERDELVGERDVMSNEEIASVLVRVSLESNHSGPKEEKSV